jgi:hypothetical protein
MRARLNSTHKEKGNILVFVRGHRPELLLGFLGEFSPRLMRLEWEIEDDTKFLF